MLQNMPWSDMYNKSFSIIAGPCSVESYAQMEEVFKALVKYSDVIAIRGGTFKPRTNPNSFQGLKEEGIKILEQLKFIYKKPIVTEIMDSDDIKYFNNVDVIQIGARNMQNFSLLTKVAKLQKPIILKRGFGNTIDELLSSAEYIKKAGNQQIILCERGIRTFENSMRFTLDLSSVVYLKENTDYPVIVDPSHAAGDSKYVIPLARAAKGAGADGLIVEVHPHPEEALSDANQQLTLEEFDLLEESLQSIR